MKESTIDDKVLRLLRTVLRYGFLDRPQWDPADATYSVADRAVALSGALESITLLKNDGALLPAEPSQSEDHRRYRSRRMAGGGRWRRLFRGACL